MPANDGSLALILQQQGFSSAVARAIDNAIWDAGIGAVAAAQGASTYDGPAATGNDDTVLLQQFIDDMSSTATAAKRQLKLRLPENQVYLMNGLFLGSNLDLDLNGSELRKNMNADYSGGGASTARAAVLRARVQKTGNSWYGMCDNMTVRNGTLNANNKDTLAVLDLYNVRGFVADGLTLITSQWSRNWATRGGGYAVFRRGRILGQAGLFQDGAHWQYGGCVWDDWYVEAGDDALAAGDDAVSANVYMDDQGLDYFIARNIQVASVRGAAVKVYTAATKPFSGAPNNYTKTGRVRGVDVQVSGKCGLLRNGGVSVFSHRAANSRNPEDLMSVRVHAALDVGVAGNAVWDAVSGTIVGSPTSVSQASSAVVTLNGHGLSAGQVVTFMVAPGGMNLLNGFYQVRAQNLAANTFEISDIAYRNNVGLDTTSAPAWTTGQLVRVGSGEGYAVGDELTVSGGTFVRPARYLVTQVSGTGAVEAVRRLDEGEYSELPPTPNTPTGGAGTGCTLQLYLTHDGVNAYGVKCVAGSDVVVTGRIAINDTTGSATRFKSFWITDSRNVDLACEFPVVPADGGLLANDSNLQLSSGNKIRSRMRCPDGLTLNSGMSPIMLANSDGTVVSGAVENLPANASAVAFPIGGNRLDTRNIVAITGSSNSAFQVAHGNWKAGQIVRILGNVLSSGSLDGYYIIRRVYDNSSFALKTLDGAQVGLGAATVTTLGQIEVANNTAFLRDFRVTTALNTGGHVGVQAANTTPHRVFSVTLENCDLSAAETPVALSVTQAPRYAIRDSKV